MTIESAMLDQQLMRCEKVFKQASMTAVTGSKLWLIVSRRTVLTIRCSTITLLRDIKNIYGLQLLNWKRKQTEIYGYVG